MTRRHHIHSKDGNDRASRRAAEIQRKRDALSVDRAVVRGAVQSWRGDKGTAHERGYTYQWQQSSRLYLQSNPLCVFCLARGAVCAAEVVDHIKPHQGNMTLFWCVENWQALCKSCHDNEKKEIETKGYSTAVGLDGWPLDGMHPVNVKDKAMKNNDNLRLQEKDATGGYQK